MRSVHAMTDVTGFGLLGHLLEMCRGSQVGARIEFGRLPLHPGVLELARNGVATGASNRNWTGCGKDVVLADGLDGAARALLTDPQTSGGLLVACVPDAVDEVLAVFRNEGLERATAIGQIVPGIPQVTVL
jgi:selenide,water dikinase